MSEHKEWVMLLGRFQCLPPHEGHQTLVRKLLEEGKNVCIALREEDGTDKNPYSQYARKCAFYKIFEKEINQKRVCIISVPDIIEVAYGRTPGWKITEIKLDDKLEQISATEKRNENKKD